MAQNKSIFKSKAVSTLILLVAVLIFGVLELKPNLLSNHANSETNNQPAAQATNTSQDSKSPNKNAHKEYTGDSQIDNTLNLIQQGGPYTYPHKDGTTFFNREGLLPKQKRGYYKEYTVPTPGVSHRGARRIVTGGNPPEYYYLTEDHYETFTKLNVTD